MDYNTIQNLALSKIFYNDPIIQNIISELIENIKTKKELLRNQQRK